MDKPKISASKVEIYTDGSCDPNPGPGGWAAIILDGKERKILKGFESNSTNNRMELTAALEALKHVDSLKPIRIFTDSQYLQKGVEEWLANWKARNWKRKGGVLANIDLWKEISEEITRHKIVWRWIKGHAGNPYNEQADRIAKQEIVIGKK
jgi:ribonuclease HI